MAIDAKALRAKGEKLFAQVRVLEREIEVIEQSLRPLKAELLTIRRQLEGSVAGLESAAKRKEGLAKRNRLICTDARKLQGRDRDLGSPEWQEVFAEKYGLSARQILRIVRAGDIKVRSQP
jgi:hypothetical protein